MANFLMRLAARTLGVAPAAQPIIAPMFAPGPAMGGEYPIETTQEIEATDDPGQHSIIPDRETRPAFSRPESPGEYPVVESEDAPSMSITPPLQAPQEYAHAGAEQQAHQTPGTLSTSHRRSAPAQDAPDTSAMPHRRSVPAQAMHKQASITVQPLYVASSSPGQSSAHPLHPADNIPVQSEQDTMSLAGTRSPTQVEYSLHVMQEPIEVPFAGVQSSMPQAKQEDTSASVTRIVSRGDDRRSVNTPMTAQPDHSMLQPEIITPDRGALTPGVIRPHASTHIEVVESARTKRFGKTGNNGLEEDGSIAISAAPTIQVTIGRIEVRATPPPPLPPMQSQAQDTTPPVMSLDQYLHQRAKGDHQ
jgi:hypothetical protein